MEKRPLDFVPFQQDRLNQWHSVCNLKGNVALVMDVLAFSDSRQHPQSLELTIPYLTMSREIRPGGENQPGYRDGIATRNSSRRHCV